jgi:hypothetical protein
MSLDKMISRVNEKMAVKEGTMGRAWPGDGSGRSLFRGMKVIDPVF